MFASELPADRAERWALLGRFIGRWFPNPRGNAGVTASDLQGAEQRLGLSLPIALREWYVRFGARRDVWSVQDRFSLPSELAVDRDVLILCAEDQDVVHWGIRFDDLAAEDPPVVVSDPSGGKTWFVESPTTSAFATQLAAMNVKWSASIRCHANGQGTEEAFAAIERTYSRLPLHEMHWPAWPTRFYAGDDLLIETNGNDWIWASARTQAAFARFDTLCREAGIDEWEAYED